MKEGRADALVRPARRKPRFRTFRQSPSLYKLIQVIYTVDVRSKPLMALISVRSVWTSRLTLLAIPLALFASGCSGFLPAPAAAPDTATRITASDDDDYSQLVAQLRSDLNRYNSREILQKPT